MKVKSQKAITLVALIITIIVLLILAVVAIRAVTGDGIIAHAKNARDIYNQSQINENTKLSNYELILAQETGNAWKQEKTKVSKGSLTLEVGQIVTNYVAGGKTWKVLGAENGNLLLMSTTNVKDNYELKGSIASWSAEEYKFVGMEATLDNECKIAIPDIGEAISIRSIKVEDINRITGYNPIENKKDIINQYGNEVTYSLKDGKIAYASTIKSGDTSNYSCFMHPDGRKIGENGVEDITIKSNYYLYYPTTLTDSSNGDIKGIVAESKAYKMLFRNEEDTENTRYWLSSSYENTIEGNARFGLRTVNDGSVSTRSLWYSDVGSSSDRYDIRPVISLPNEFQPEV